MGVKDGGIEGVRAVRRSRGISGVKKVGGESGRGEGDLCGVR